MSNRLPKTKREKCLELPSIKGPSHVSLGGTKGQESGVYVGWGGGHKPGQGMSRSPQKCT